MRFGAATVTGWLLAGLLGCGAGPYGYARTYVNLGDEEPYARRANDVIYDEVVRLPERYQGQLISWFGVVSSVEPGPSGAARVTLHHRTHQERHLCEEAEAENTCRVTINAENGGAFTALVRLTSADQNGENRVQTGSLVRVYGQLVPGEHGADNGPVLRVQYYRHWPRGQFVTTAARGNFRQ
jgi:hypothetical protein